MEIQEAEALHGSHALVQSVARREPSTGAETHPPSKAEFAQTSQNDQEMAAEVAAQVAHALNEFVSAVNVGIAFLVDQATGRTVIKVIDRETNEIIRQVPPEEMLRLVARMNHVLGVLLNHQA
ncbi:MAG: flagellar protein FlaG [candidate division KSB1 bacterium]|nr:flagellar protein FlaG [candidate division KSB1 bacterium]